MEYHQKKIKNRNSSFSADSIQHAVTQLYLCEKGSIFLYKEGECFPFHPVALEMSGKHFQTKQKAAPTRTNRSHCQSNKRQSEVSQEAKTPTPHERRHTHTH